MTKNDDVGPMAMAICQRSANKVIIITSDFDGANLCDYLSNCLADGHVTITPPPLPLEHPNCV